MSFFIVKNKMQSVLFLNIRERISFIKIKRCTCMINILLSGCKGNMGTALTNYIKDSTSFNLLYGIDKENCDLFHKINKKPDVIIDFSTPSSTFMALNYAIENLIPIVIATTGFKNTDEIKIREFSEAIPIFKSSNMSFGINVFSNIASILAQKLDNTDIEIVEKHHRQKVDAPSGTAFMIADKINRKCNGKYQYVFSRHDSSTVHSPKSYNDIGFSSIRGGDLVGEHTVFFIRENEMITITHSAYSRNIYIEGALRAAKFILTKKNGLYNMEDLEK